MANNLVQLIFDQFLEIVEGLSRKSCFDFDECDFDYRVRELVGHRLIDVIYVVEDKCGRRRDVIVTIDFTNICVEDLITCKWVEYLEKLAHEFVNDICPKRLMIVKDEPKKCRPQPPKWEPFPCRNITTVIRKKKPVPKEPECEIIIEKECECVPLCKREPCVPKQQVIVKYEEEKPWKCGDFSILVEEPKEKHHDFKWHKGNKDFNHHQWKKCCDGLNKHFDTKADHHQQFYANSNHH
ncbi:hypothetical protein QJ856_gp0110 [Tupanvirus deep ocean]|uniref:Uncharacterized protein n=2 Tax=Tupanvirus TaxID=2094720 RepID=A0AC62AAA7_9VIRU|nr:hypothetical protein QJ856_gp0110 [Tupanvirus deep ocean]QKU34617.1 hypothetical protein [Tupanvirus deep ocean]